MGVKTFSWTRQGEGNGFKTIVVEIVPGTDKIAKDAQAAGLKGFSGLCEHKVYSDADGQMHVRDICRGAGLGKYYPECLFRDGSFAYYTEREPIVEDNLQGVGPFLLACLEADILKNWNVHLRCRIGNQLN
ncbi:MAG TPA: hypothetical protein VJ863_11520, partial [Sphaerochaeta sp.]|nr:hypothetical protein [Sphaerochaeta sp.]